MQTGVLCFTWLSLFDKLDFFFSIFTNMCQKKLVYSWIPTQNPSMLLQSVLLFWDQDSWLTFDQHTNMTSCKVVKSNSNNFYIDSDKCLTLLFSLFPFYGTCIGATWNQVACHSFQSVMNFWGHFWPFFYRFELKSWINCSLKLKFFYKIYKPYP